MFLNRENSIRIYYETYGEQNNTPLLLIHGLGADHHMFKYQIERYEEEGFFIVAPDMRGHGKSSRVNTLELLDWVEDINALIEHLQLQKPILLGVSMGGVIVQQFVVEHPSTARKIVLADTFGEIKSFQEKAGAYAQQYGFKVFKYLSKRFASDLVASAYKNDSQEVYDYFKKVTLEADFEQLYLARKAINKIDVLDELKEIPVPALVIVGNRADIMLEPAQKLDRSLPVSELRVIEDSLDPSNMTRPQLFDEYVLEFIQK